MKRICWYLQITKENGLVFNPSKKLVVDCYADADFAGLWGNEDPQGPICASSRTGFVVTFYNFPLFCLSKIQTEIALSTLHSEYAKLYHSVSALLPLKSLIKEVIDNLGIYSKKPKFVLSSTIYEGNNGYIVVARIPRKTPTSNYIAFKYHCFRQYVGKELVIRNIESKNQNADIFTKGLQGEIFVRISKLLCEL